MNVTHDYNHKLLQWQFKNLKRLGETYRSISRRSGVPQATLCDVINGTVRPFPNTIKKTFVAVGLNPNYAFSEIRKNDFHLAVL